jgi:hypothetical protein
MIFNGARDHPDVIPGTNNGRQAGGPGVCGRGVSQNLFERPHRSPLPMKPVCLILCLVVLAAGCARRPVRPGDYPARNYPLATLADIRTAETLTLEKTDIGLDGGSQVYILSTPKRKQVQLWNLCHLAKEARGHDPRLNVFMLKVGEGRANELMVEPGSEMETLLIARLPLEIANGVRNRRTPLP